MPFSCLSEEIAAAPVPMEITPSQRMMSACAGVLTVSMVVTPMGEILKTTAAVLVVPKNDKRSFLERDRSTITCTRTCGESVSRSIALQQYSLFYR